MEERKSFVLFSCLNACFTFDHQTLQSIQGQTRHGCTNDIIAVQSFALSCLLYSSSTSIFDFGERFVSHRNQTLPNARRLLYPQIRALTQKIHILFRKKRFRSKLYFVKIKLSKFYETKFRTFLPMFINSSFQHCCLVYENNGNCCLS